MKRTTQKMLAVFLGILLIMCDAATVSLAENCNVYQLDELGISISIPNELVVFTRDTGNNDPNLSLYGLTKDGLLSIMEESNIYMNAWNATIDFEIVITMTQNENDFSELSDTFLWVIAANIKTEFAKYERNVTDYTLYKQQSKFIKLSYNWLNNSSPAYSQQYCTVENGKAINITLHSYNGEITAEEDAMLKAIVDSIQFGEDAASVSEKAATSSSVYEDKDTGAKFTIPADWTEKPLSEERKYIDARFENADTGGIILYGSTDVWGELSLLEKIVISRKDLDEYLSSASEEEISEMLGEKLKFVGRKYYAEKEYLVFETTTEEEIIGLEVNMKIIQAMRTENGYVYLFQTCKFSENETDENYADFEALLNSVIYPEITAVTKE